MSPPKSKCWLYFTKLSKETAQCNICSKILKTSGNTSNLMGHITKKHSNVYNKNKSDNISEVNKEVAEEIPCKKAKLTATNTGSESEIMPSCSFASTVTVESNNSHLEMFSPSISSCSSSSTCQPTITKAFKTVQSYSDGGSHNLRINNALAKFIYKDNMPFSTVEGEGFKNLIKELNPLYKIPTRNTIKNLIDKKYDTLVAVFREKMSAISNVSITTDIWTDLQTKSFLGITVHFIEDTQMVSACLGVKELNQSHTADYIGSQILKILEEWKISNDKIVAITTDNGANMVRAVYDIFGKNRHIPCFAHTINLVCENVLKNSGELMALLEQVREIIKWFKRSVAASDQLRKHQIEAGIPEGKLQKLILDVKTRWNSTFYMLQRFCDLAPMISSIVFNNVNAPGMITSVDLQNIRESLKILQPLERVTKELCAEKFVTISKIIPVVACITEEYNRLQPKTVLGQQMKDAVLNEMKKRFFTIEKSFLLAISTMLDPRFKNIHFKDPLAVSSVMKYIRDEIKNNCVEEESESDCAEPCEHEANFDLWAYHKKLAHTQIKKGKQQNLSGTHDHDEVSQYLHVTVRSLAENPLVVWEEMKLIYPNLYLMANKFLGASATSVPSERLFSKAGATASKTRNRLTSKHLSKLLFLNSLPLSVS